jgi:hypothetical protein
MRVRNEGSCGAPAKPRDRVSRRTDRVALFRLSSLAGRAAPRIRDAGCTVHLGPKLHLTGRHMHLQLNPASCLQQLALWAAAHERHTGSVTMTRILQHAAPACRGYGRPLLRRTTLPSEATSRQPLHAAPGAECSTNVAIARSVRPPRRAPRGGCDGIAQPEAAAAMAVCTPPPLPPYQDPRLRLIVRQTHVPPRAECPVCARSLIASGAPCA